jgi:hypothetical protein
MNTGAHATTELEDCQQAFKQINDEVDKIQDVSGLDMNVLKEIKSLHKQAAAIQDNASYKDCQKHLSKAQKYLNDLHNKVGKID